MSTRAKQCDPSSFADAGDNSRHQLVQHIVRQDASIHNWIIQDLPSKARLPDAPGEPVQRHQRVWLHCQHDVQVVDSAQDQPWNDLHRFHIRSFREGTADPHPRPSNGVLDERTVYHPAKLFALNIVQALRFRDSFRQFVRQKLSKKYVCHPVLMQIDPLPFLKRLYSSIRGIPYRSKPFPRDPLIMHRSHPPIVCNLWTPYFFPAK